MTLPAFPLLEALAIIRALERDVLVLVALFPAQALHFAWIASQLREALR